MSFYIANLWMCCYTLPSVSKKPVPIALIFLISAYNKVSVYLSRHVKLEMSCYVCIYYIYNYMYIYVVISYLYPHTHTLLDTLSSVLNTEIYGSPAVSEHHIEKNSDWTSAVFSIFGPSQLHHPPKKTWLGHPRNSCSATPEELAMAKSPGMAEVPKMAIL